MNPAWPANVREGDENDTVPSIAQPILSRLDHDSHEQTTVIRDQYISAGERRSPTYFIEP
jgi:hypothetical protein